MAAVLGYLDHTSEWLLAVSSFSFHAKVLYGLLSRGMVFAPID